MDFYQLIVSYSILEGERIFITDTNGFISLSTVLNSPDL